ncbi:Zinc transporter ZIP1 [Orchesella cincta]|uniref:Zinc transporter ZIP1 n=1 Tax=Orchesella cincta TaxID=48709 RepID=A0A1D2NKS6_ORCCI|nr:Zinc transporter ZIP1 [Orchesella cincta]
MVMIFLELLPERKSKSQSQIYRGLAAGSLLYVTFFEIFQEEGRKLDRKYIHILVAILGFVMMGALEFIGGHKHGGSQNHSHTSHGNETWDDHSDLRTGHHNETDEAHHHDHDHDHEH